MLPAGLAKMHRAFPVTYDETGLQVAMVNPLDPQGVEDLRFNLGKELNLVIADYTAVEALVNDFYASDTGLGDILEELRDAGLGGDEADLEDEANAAPIIPIPFERELLSVTSATAAVATERLPAIKPPTSRDKTRIQNEPANTHSE